MTPTDDSAASGPQWRYFTSPCGERIRISRNHVHLWADERWHDMGVDVGAFLTHTSLHDFIETTEPGEPIAVKVPDLPESVREHAEFRERTKDVSVGEYATSAEPGETPRTDAFEKDLVADDDHYHLRMMISHARTLEREAAGLRDIFPKILDALGNGSACTPDASFDLLKSIPTEVRLVIQGHKHEAAALRDEVVRLRGGEIIRSICENSSCSFRIICESHHIEGEHNADRRLTTRPSQTMKIQPTANNLKVAAEVIKLVNGMATDKALTITNGELQIIAQSELADEEVICDRIEPDSFGEGWDSDEATPADMLDTLNECI